MSATMISVNAAVTREIMGLPTLSGSRAASWVMRLSRYITVAFTTWPALSVRHRPRSGRHEAPNAPWTSAHRLAKYVGVSPVVRCANNGLSRGRESFDARLSILSRRPLACALPHRCRAVSIRDILRTARPNAGRASGGPE